MFIDYKEYFPEPGDIVFRRPGQTTQGIMPYECYAIFFNVTDQKQDTPKGYWRGDKELRPNYQNGLLDAIPMIFHLADTDFYQKEFEVLLKSFLHPGPNSPLVNRAGILRILNRLYLDATNPFTDDDKTNTVTGAVQNVLRYVKMNSEKELNLITLAQKANLSPNYFHKLFTGLMKITPNEYIIKIRMEKARELLVRTNLSLTEIGFECGLSSLQYFSYLFRKKNGVSPKEFREMHRTGG
jgi:AraC-like DNA-binding protein